jgi:hypothetical protein
MVLALGVVVMHHVIDAHTDSGDPAHGSASMTMPAIEIQDCCAAPPVAVVAVAVRPVQPGPDGELMLHPCLAVLTGLMLLAGLVAARWLTHSSHTRLPAGAVGKDPPARHNVPTRASSTGPRSKETD